MAAGGPPGCGGWPRNTRRPSSVFGLIAIAAVMANEPAETAARLALRALDGAPKLLPEPVDRPPFFYHACIALMLAERYGDALSRSTKR